MCVSRSALCVHVCQSVGFLCACEIVGLALCVHVCQSDCLVCACVTDGLPCVCMCVSRCALCVGLSAL